MELEVPQVVAIPRGGVVVAAPVAKEVKSDIKLIIPRKVGAPQQPELAAGAVTPDGEVYYNKTVMQLLGLTPQLLEKNVERELREMQSREKRYGKMLKENDVAGRSILLVDDGIATGFTVVATVSYLKRMLPKHLYLLIPVAPQDTVEKMQVEFDQVVCLESPVGFTAVGAYYQIFEQVQDKEVQEILQKFGEA